MRASFSILRGGRPDLVIDRANDETPLPDCRGWTCGGCDTLYSDQSVAEACCVAPDVVVTFR